MYWEKNKLTYDLLIPPINKPFEAFSKHEAENYFRWYIGKLNERVVYLQEFSGVSLDYSVDSLNDIWAWFLKNAEIEKTPKEKLCEIKKQLKKQPNEIRNVVLKEQSEQFSLQTEYIIRDIAMYFGEVFVKNNSSISWGYHCDIKKDSFANMPLLVGFEDRNFNPPFKAELEPCFFVRRVACNIFDGDQKKDDLSDIYETWQRMVFN